MEKGTLLFCYGRELPVAYRIPSYTVNLKILVSRAVSVVLFIFLFLSQTAVLAQQLITNETEVRHLDVMLTNNTVTTIYQDQSGFLWFGTYNGLNRFDGINLRAYYYEKADTQSLTHYRIEKITGDNAGNIWIATTNGLNRYNADFDNFTRYYHDVTNPKSVAGGSLTDILSDSQDRLWVFGDQVSLYNYEEDIFLNYTLGDAQSIQERANSYNRIFEDRRGRIWFLYNKDIYYYSPETNKMQLFFDGNRNPLSDGPWYFMHIIQLDDENFWLSTNGAGIILARPYESDQLMQFTDFKGIPYQDLENVQILQLYRDSKDQIWITVENQGIYVFDKQANLIKRFVNNRDDVRSIAYNSIWSVYEDNAKRIWLGTWQSGIDVIDRYDRKFKHYKYTPGVNSLSHDLVREIVEDPEGNLYIALDGGGLNYFDRQKGVFVEFIHEPGNSNSLSTNSLLPLEFDNQGNLWIGTWNGGINRMSADQRRISHFTPSNSGISSPNVFDILYDGKGKMYIATWGGGLCSYDLNTGVWKAYLHDEADDRSICSDYIFSLNLDSNGNVWIGTTDGLDVLKYPDSEKGLFFHYRFDTDDPNSLSDNTINTIYEDPDKNIWIGTVNGLNLYQPEKSNFKRYGTADGLLDENINSIIRDGSGHYWLGTNKGLVRFSPEPVEFRNYDVIDGIQGYEYSRNSVLLLKSGEIAIGGTKGLNIFHPDSIKENPYKPPLEFTGFKIFNKDVVIGSDSPLQRHISHTKNIRLNHTQDVFTFEFVALNYTHPEKNQYAYKMEGFDQDWIYVYDQKATYTNLDPGKYTFRVKAANNDGLWNEEGISINIEILPPWWATTWFRILAFLLIISLVVGGIMLRTRQHNRARRELEKKVREATHSIEIQNAKLEDAKAALGSLIDNVKNKLGSASSKLMDASNGQAVSIEEISSSVEQIVTDLNENTRETSDIFNRAREVQSNASASVKAIEEAAVFIKKISSEIATILEITQQTKFVALNAAIESARAGEQGKSFSVVAKEVKKLSERSELVAENIADLSTSGLKLSNTVNEKINDLLTFISSIVDIIGRVSASSENQSAKVDNINSAIQEMSNFVNHTAQQVQELDQAIKSLATKDEYE